METKVENQEIPGSLNDDGLGWRWLTNLHVLKVMVREVLEGDCPLPEHDNHLTFSQVHLIKLIQRGCDEEEGWSLRKLASYMQVSLPAVSKAIGRLTPHDYLVIKGDTQDGRKRRVTVTERGLEALESFKHCREERLRMLVSMGGTTKLPVWNQSLEGMIELLTQICREGYVPGLECKCPDDVSETANRHLPGCPVRRHLHHLDE